MFQSLWHSIYKKNQHWWNCAFLGNKQIFHSTTSTKIHTHHNVVQPCEEDTYILFFLWSTVGKPCFVWVGWDFTWWAYSVGTSGPAALLSKSYAKHGQNTHTHTHTHTHIDKQLHSSNLDLKKWSIAIPLLMMMTKGFEIRSMLYWLGLPLCIL
jgi:hypothetical protein